MWKKIAVAGGTIALIGGVGTAALAASGSNTPSSGSSAANGPGNSAAAHGKGKGLRGARGLERLKNFEHGTWVTQGKDQSSVTHTAWHGTVTAISPTSITVKAKDNSTETFTLNSSTKVHTKAQRKDAPISSVQNGDTVLVAGTGSGTPSANQVVDTSR